MKVGLISASDDFIDEVVRSVDLFLVGGTFDQTVGGAFGESSVGPRKQLQSMVWGHNGCPS